MKRISILMLCAMLFMVYSVACSADRMITTEVVDFNAEWTSCPPTFASNSNAMTVNTGKMTETTVAMYDGSFQVSTVPKAKRAEVAQFAINSQMVTKNRPVNSRAPAAMNDCTFTFDNTANVMDENRGSPAIENTENLDFKKTVAYTDQMTLAPPSTVQSQNVAKKVAWTKKNAEVDLRRSTTFTRNDANTSVAITEQVTQVPHQGTQGQNVVSQDIWAGMYTEIDDPGRSLDDENNREYILDEYAIYNVTGGQVIYAYPNPYNNPFNRC